MKSLGPHCIESKLLWTIALLAMATTAFATLFTTWAVYDDEGYILWTLIHHSQGSVLYENIYTQYGPAFYVLDVAFRNIIPLPYTTDGQRWQTLLFWLTSALLLFGSLRNLSRTSIRSLTTKSTTLFSVLLLGLLLWHQERLALEPGHPQIWCTLLVSLSIFLLTNRTSDSSHFPSWILISVLGLISGLLLMIKPNVGILFTAALPAIFLWSHKNVATWFRSIELIYTGCIVAIPWLLTHKQIDSISALVLPTLVTISLLALRATLLQSPQLVTINRVRERQVLGKLCWLAATLIATALFFVVWSAQRGISPLVLKQALFGQHGTLLQLYFFPAIRSSLGLSGLAMLAAFFAVQLGAKSKFFGTEFRQKSENGTTDFLCKWNSIVSIPNETRLSIFLVLTTIVVASVMWLDSLNPLSHGLRPRGCAELLLALSPAIVCAWLSLRLNKGSDVKHLAVLATIACLQPLIAFPVPGTQLALGTLPLLLLLVDGCQLGIVHLTSQPYWADILERFPKRLAFYQRLTLFAAIIPTLLSTQRYCERNSLNLPGAFWLRLSADETIQTRELISTLQKQKADAIVFRWHNRPSWYLWAQCSPPFEQLPPSWTYLISDERQREQLKTLTKFQRVLVIDEAYEPRQIPPPSPLHEAWRRSQKLCEYGSEFSLLLWTPNKSVSSEKNRIE